MFAQPRPRKVAPPPPKKRKVQHAVEEITFDKEARAEYLTGFHKRKQARIKEAQKIAEEKERLERIATRKQIREERKQALEEHVQTINQILREAEVAGQAEKGQEDSDEWGGLSDTEVVEEPPMDLEEEYIDEDKYTTVTVEAVSVDRDGLHKPKLDDSDEENARQYKKTAEEEAKEKKDKKGPPKWAKDLPKKKKFRYENKVDRAMEARKQKAKRRKPKGDN
ncbi:nucleolar protein 12-domain-containing protein [Podospora australis]|uniref:Nucleolar protein 12-domain-containing protein n=1 Tax=Podospora australis TaxID=1536484 RepID=A0AAN6X6H3_9PEZI|nr:nucleolar protein 12-domain-containing protein [Podospora australis]